MKILRLVAVAVLLSSAPVMAAESGHEGHDMHAGHAMPMTHKMAPAKQKSAADAEYDAAMAEMHAGMMIKPSGDADVDFMRGMIAHHQGAINMARIVLRHGDDPQAKALARNIIVAQKSEISYMKRWLARRQLSEK